MTRETTEETQLYLETFIPEAVSQMMTSYQDFLNTDTSCKDIESIKEFLEFHKACKAAISNIENLLKLYQWTEKEKQGGLSPEEISKKIEGAEERIKKYLYKNPLQEKI